MFKNNKGVEKYFYNTFWMFLEKVLRIISGLLVGVWLARYLGPEKFGIFSYIIAFAAISSVLSRLGLEKILILNLVKKSEYYPIYLGTGFWLKLISAILIFCTALILIYGTHESAINNTYLLIVTTGLFFHPFEVIDYYFQSKTLYRYVSICKILQILLSSALKVFFILKNCELIYFFILYLFDQFFLSILYILAYKKVNKFINFFTFNYNVALKLLTKSWPLLFSSAVVFIYMKVDLLMIKRILDENAAGQYAASLRIVETLFFIPIILNKSLYPAIIKAKSLNAHNYYKKMQALYTLLFWSGLIISIVFFVFSKYFIYFVYGDSYSKTVDVFSIHVWSFIPVSFGIVLGSHYVIFNKIFENLIRNLIGAILNIVLNLYLIKKYGIEGAAISSIISYIYISFIHSILKEHSRDNLKCMLKSINILNLKY